MKKFILIPILLGCFALPLSAQTLKVGVVSDVSSLDPHTAIDTISSAVLFNIFENLVTFHPKSLNIVAGLAESWTHSEDWTKWTYKLRPGITFHDGTKLTADVVVNSFQYAPNFSAKVRKIDDMTVEFALSEGNAQFNDYLAQPYYSIVPPSAKKKKMPYGTGPFVYKSRIKGKSLIIEANPSWWGGKVNIERVEYIVFPDQSSLVEAVINKKIDLAEWLTSDAVINLRKHPYLYVETKLGSNVGFLSMNVENELLSNVKVREAIASAINVVDLARKFFPGASGAPASTVIPPTLFKMMIKPTPYDPVKAKKLLESSGADLSKPLRLLESWSPRPYMPNPHGIALEIKKYLEDIGLKVIVTPDPDNYFERMQGGDIDLCLNGWIADNGDPVEFLAASFHTRSIGHNNASRWSNVEFDKLLSRAKVQEGYSLKMSIKNALDIYHREIPSISLFWGAQSAVWNTRVQGYSVHPSSQMMLKNVQIKNGIGK